MIGLAAGDNLPRGHRRYRPKVEALHVLEAVHDLTFGPERDAYLPTVMDVAVKAGCSRNSAGDRLNDLWLEGLVSRTLMEALKGTGKPGRPPIVFDVTREGRDRIAKARNLASDVDLATQADRFDRAAQFLEDDAAAIEFKVAGFHEVDPRQIGLPIEIEIPALGGPA